MRKTLKKLYRNNRGMSIVEVIIAITILGVVAVPVLHSLTTSMVYNAKARKRQELTLTAETIMETFKGYDLDSLKDRFSGGGAGGVSGIEGVNYKVVDVDSGYHYTAMPVMVGTEAADEYTFCIDDIYTGDTEPVNNDQLYDVTITATPNSVEKIMVQDNMEATHDAVFRADRGFDSSALQKAKAAFNTSAHQSDLADDFRDRHSDAVIKLGTDIIDVKDEISRIFEESSGIFYVGNYVKLHERELRFEIKEESGSHVVRPKMVYYYNIEGYPYYIRKEPSSDDGDDEYDPPGTSSDDRGTETIVQNDSPSTISYPETGYFEVSIDLSSVCDGDGTIYKNPTALEDSDGNPKTVLNRLFIYYYPQYNVSDKIVIDNQAGIAGLQCYILKQRTASLNDTQLSTKENGYHANVSISDSTSSLVLFHNFDDNIGDGSSTTAPSISGASAVYSYTKAAPGGGTELEARFSEKEVLSYRLALEVTQNGRTITTLESSMNEKLK